MKNIRNEYRTPWLWSAPSDLIFILSPPFLVSILVIALPQLFHNDADTTPLLWLILVLGIDVSHVYSTLYKTYFDNQEWKENKTLYLALPGIAMAASVILYSMSPMFFWRVLAYIAVFHFARQQYGFMRLYSRYETFNVWNKRIDSLMIYSATVFPMLYWHFSGPKNFQWFTENDFLFVEAPALIPWLYALYFFVLSIYIAKEIKFSLQHGFNWPKNLLIAGTVLSWYLGIVVFDGDLTFTALNVVSHGVPYMALIWMYGKKKNDRLADADRSWLKIVFGKTGILIFILSLLMFAYLEEGLWDAWVWQDHEILFPFFHTVLTPLHSAEALSIIVPLLTLPQLTHYLLDGFIWKIKQEEK